MTGTYSTSEVAKLLGKHRSTIARLASNGDLDFLGPLKIGTCWRFPRAILDSRLEVHDEA